MDAIVSPLSEVGTEMMNRKTPACRASPPGAEITRFAVDDRTNPKPSRGMFHARYELRVNTLGFCSCGCIGRPILERSRLQFRVPGAIFWNVPKGTYNSDRRKSSGTTRKHRQNRSRRPIPTILDVARRAGVSKSLVSMVTRGEAGVSEEKRAAILKAIDELDYRPNAMAQGLVMRQTRILGVMVSDLQNPFFAAVISGIQERAERSLDFGSSSRPATAPRVSRRAPSRTCSSSGSTV